MTSLKLLGQEVLPAMREMAHERTRRPLRASARLEAAAASGVREPVVGQTAVAS